MLGNLFRGTTHHKKCVNKKQNLPVTVNKKQNVEVVIPAPDGDHEIFSFPWSSLGAEIRFVRFLLKSVL